MEREELHQLFEILSDLKKQLLYVSPAVVPWRGFKKIEELNYDNYEDVLFEIKRCRKELSRIYKAQRRVRHIISVIAPQSHIVTSTSTE